MRRRASQFPSERAAKDNWIWCWYLPAACKQLEPDVVHHQQRERCCWDWRSAVWVRIVSSFAICLQALFVVSVDGYVAKEWHMTFFNLPLYYKLFGEKMTSCGNILIELQCLSVALANHMDLMWFHPGATMSKESCTFMKLVFTLWQRFSNISTEIAFEKRTSAHKKIRGPKEYQRASFFFYTFL